MFVCLFVTVTVSVSSRECRCYPDTDPDTFTREFGPKNMSTDVDEGGCIVVETKRNEVERPSGVGGAKEPNIRLFDWFVLVFHYPHVAPLWLHASC